MSVILEQFYTYKDKYKQFIPERIYMTLKIAPDTRAEMLEPTKNDRDKYFIEGLEDLSLAVFNLLFSGRGYYIMNYANEFKVNRKAAGFKTKEDLIHYSIWVLEKFLSAENERIKHLDELKSNSEGKTDEEMMNDFVKEKVLSDELREVTFNAKSEEDFIKRMVLLEELKKYKTLGYHLLNSFSFYQIVDDLYVALEAIPNVHKFNVPPVPVKQNEWEFRTV